MSFEQRVISDIFRGKFIPLNKEVVNLSYLSPIDDKYSVSYTIYQIALSDKYKNETGETVEINLYYDEFGIENMLELFNYNGGYTINNNSEFDVRLMENLEHALSLEVFETDNIDILKSNEGSRILINQEKVAESDIQNEYLKSVVLDALLSDSYYDHKLAEWVL